MEFKSSMKYLEVGIGSYLSLRERITSTTEDVKKKKKNILKHKGFQNVAEFR